MTSALGDHGSEAGRADRADDGSPAENDGTDRSVGDSDDEGITDEGRAHDGGHPKDAGADVGAVAPTGPTKVGRILVGQTITIAGGQQYESSYATAMFYEVPPSAGGTSCTYDKIGTCHVYDCPLGGAAADAGAVRYAGAGTVSITGGLTNYTLDIAPGSYQSTYAQELLYDVGTVLSVSSTGGEVPAFSNETLTVPATSFEVQSPSLGSSLSLVRTQALPLSWSGAGNRDVQVSISTIEQNVRSVSIACTFPGASGSGSVPAAAMKKLLATSASTKGYVSVSSPIENTFSAGDWVVTFGLYDTPESATFTTN